MVSVELKKEERQLRRNFMRFTLVILFFTAILYLVHQYVPEGIIHSKWIINLFPLIYSTIWGVVMGGLLLYGSHAIGDPLTHILKGYLPVNVDSISDGITETLIIAVSMIFAQQFKGIFEKVAKTKVEGDLWKTLAGFVLGRFLVIAGSFMQADRPLQDLRFSGHQFD